MSNHITKLFKQLWCQYITGHKWDYRNNHDHTCFEEWYECINCGKQKEVR